MNKVQFIGNLTKDFELRNLPSGRMVASGTIATNKTWTDANGQRQTKSEFHNLVAWGKQAETLAKWTHKGDKIYLEGELTHRDYTGQDGVKRYFTEIIINGFEFLPNKQRDGAARSSQNGAEPVIDVPEEEDDEIRVENIPF